MRTSTGVRAAHSVIIWAEIPAWAARSVANIGDHHSAGIESRCHHFETAEAPAPMSDAIASREGQSSITDRKEVGSDMGIVLRQSVLRCKANVSHDCGRPLGQNVPMDEQLTATAYKADFLGRVKAAREARYDTQEAVGEVLGIKQSIYSKYEVRSFMPHRLVPRFCKACGVTTDWLFSGRGAGPAWKPVFPAPKTRKKGQKQKRAA